jgi:hypothetical protein
MFCRSLFVLVCFFFWLLCCLFFFDIRILITPFYPKTLLIKVLPQRSLEFSYYSILFCLSVMVSTVPGDLQDILMGTATWRNDQEWINFKLHELCEPHGLSSGVCVCCSIDPSSVRLLLFVFMCQNFICWCRPHSCSEKNHHKTYYIHGINCISRR